jgi:hypothetical protein
MVQAGAKAGLDSCQLRDLGQHREQAERTLCHGHRDNPCNHGERPSDAAPRTKKPVMDSATAVWWMSLTAK